jgi:hypothetical protein
MELDDLPTSVAGVLKLVDEQLESWPDEEEEDAPPLALWLARFILRNLSKATDVAAMKQAIWEPILLLLREYQGFEQMVDEWEQFWPQPVEVPAAIMVSQPEVQGSAPSGASQTPSSPSNSTDTRASPLSGGTHPTSRGTSDSSAVKGSLFSNTTASAPVCPSISSDLQGPLPSSAAKQQPQQPTVCTGVHGLFHRLRCW